MDKISKGSCAKYHADAPLVVLQEDLLLEDADRRLRQRQEGLHGLHEVAAGLDRSSRAEPCSRGPWSCQSAPPRGPARARLSELGCRHRPLARRWLLPGARRVRRSSTSRRSSSLFVSAFWTVDAFTGELVHDWTTRQLPDALGRRTPTGTSRCGRSGSPRRSRSPTRVLAFPFAYFMARVARPRMRARAVRARAAAALVELPRPRLRVAADPQPRRRCSTGRSSKLGLPDANIAYTNVAVWLVFTYIWLPFMILPVYAALERIPHSLPRGLARPRRAGLADVPHGDPAARAARRRRRLDLHVLADARRLHHADARRRHVEPVHRQRRLRLASAWRATCPFAAAFATVPLAVMGVYLWSRAGSARSRRSDGDAAARRIALGVWVGARARVPLDPDRASSASTRSTRRTCRAGRSPGFTTQVVLAGAPRRRHAGRAEAVAEGGGARDRDRARARARRPRSASHRFRFFGREAVSFLLVLPIALPGIITGMALNSFFTFWQRQLRALDDRDRARDLLRRRRLQQRARAAAAHVRLADRGVDGPRRGRLADVPARHAADDLDRARSPARCSRSRSRSTR